MNISDSNAISRFSKKLKCLKENIRGWAKEKKESSKSQKTDRFEKPCSSRLMLDADFPIKLNSDQKDDLERNVTKDEIKRVVWECGTDKSPGPDGFTFGFYRRFWGILEEDVVEAVSYFFKHGTFPKGGNSSFIALIPKIQDATLVKDFRPISLIDSLYKIIAKTLTNRLVVVLGDIVNEVQSAFVSNRQILDGPFILNELIHWCKAKKKQTMIFKVDFEKAYVSVRWDYLDDVLYKFGFVVDEALFKGVSIGSSMQLSHLFYAYDAIFMGQWSDSNISTIVHALKCFHKASGLCMNLYKSKLLGVAVEVDKDEVVNRLRSRLSKWKMKTLSIGGRLTLLKSVLGSMPIYYMSIYKVPSQVLKKMEAIRCNFFNGADSNEKKMCWFKWSMALASKEKGGWEFIKATHGKMEKLVKSVDTLFWEEVWKGNTTFKNRYPRVYALELEKLISMADKLEQLSHLFYVYDVIFMGQLSDSNISTIVHALKCYHKASGLCMNLHKSKLLGVAVEVDKSWWSNVSFKILDEVVNRLRSRLSKWKMKTLSIGLWRQKRKGVGSLELLCLNRVSMFKWAWCFYTDGNSLWARFIKAIHGKDGKIGKIVSSHQPSAWIDIVNEVNKFKNLDMDLLSLLKKKVGNGLDTLFLEEVWKGDTTFKNRYPRVYALELEKLISLADKLEHVDLGSSLRRMPRDGVKLMQFSELKTSLKGLQLISMNDRWTWTMVGMGDFSVASARKYIDDKKLHGPSITTRWVKAVLIKINIMAWKVRFDYLPTRLNLSRRGLELQSILCPICNKEVLILMRNG
nr:RNA-directed DNA polymerase, eukaryota [Tanacetum cinerariifolium]